MLELLERHCAKIFERASPTSDIRKLVSKQDHRNNGTTRNSTRRILRGEFFNAVSLQDNFRKFLVTNKFPPKISSNLVSLERT